MVPQTSHFHPSPVSFSKNRPEVISTTRFGRADDVKPLSEHCHQGDPYLRCFIKESQSLPSVNNSGKEKKYLHHQLSDFRQFQFVTFLSFFFSTFSKT